MQNIIFEKTWDSIRGNDQTDPTDHNEQARRNKVVENVDTDLQ